MEKIFVSTKPFIRGTKPRIVIDIVRVVRVEVDLTVVRVEVRVRHVGVFDQVCLVYTAVATAMLFQIIKLGSILRGDVLYIAIPNSFFKSELLIRTTTCDSLEFYKKTQVTVHRLP